MTHTEKIRDLIKGIPYIPEAKELLAKVDEVPDFDPVGAAIIQATITAHIDALVEGEGCGNCDDSILLRGLFEVFQIIYQDAKENVEVLHTFIQVARDLKVDDEEALNSLLVVLIYITTK